MNFEIQRDDLLLSLQKVIGVIEKANTIKVLSNILIRTEKEKLICIGSDSNIQIISCAKANVHSNGETTVLAKKLHDICRYLPEKSIMRIKHENNNLVVGSGRSRFSLKTLPSKNFPILKEIEADQEIIISSPVLKGALEKTAFSMGLEDVRKFLNGLNLVFRGEYIEIFGTDGHRMARMIGKLKSSADKCIKIVMPRKAVTELLRVVDDQYEDVSISVSSKNINFKLENVYFSAKLLDGKFPDYRNIIPPDSDQMLVIDRDEFKNALIRVSILSNELDRGVLFKFENGKLILKSNNSDHEQALEEVDIDYSALEFAVGYNSSYVLEALQKIDSDHLKIAIDQTKHSMLLTSNKSNDSKFLIMPMKI